MKLNKHWHYIVLLVALLAINLFVQRLASSVGGDSAEFVVAAFFGIGIVAVIIAWIKFALNKEKNKTNLKVTSKEKKKSSKKPLPFKTISVALGALIIISAFIGATIFYKKEQNKKNNEAYIAKLNTVIDASKNFDNLFIGTKEDNYWPNNEAEKNLISKVSKLSVQVNGQDRKLLDDWIKQAQIVNKVVCQCMPDLNYSEFSSAHNALDSMNVISNKLSGRVETLKIIAE